MKATLLKYDGWHLASILEIYAPPGLTGDPVMWRVLCREGELTETENTLVLFPLPGPGIVSPPAQITGLESVFEFLNFVVRHCACAFTPEAEQKAREVLCHDIVQLTGHELTDETLYKLLRHIRDDLATDNAGNRLGERCSGFDGAQLAALVDAIAKATAVSVASIRQKLLAARCPELAAHPEVNRINYLALFTAKPREIIVPVERYIIDPRWSAEDRLRVTAHARPELLVPVTGKPAQEASSSADPDASSCPINEVLLWTVQREIETKLAFKKAPGHNQVFSLYCRDNMTLASIWRKLKCGEKLVDRRVRELRNFLWQRHKLTLEAFRVDATIWQAAEREREKARQRGRRVDERRLADSD